MSFRIFNAVSLFFFSELLSLGGGSEEICPCERDWSSGLRTYDMLSCEFTCWRRCSIYLIALTLSRDRIC